MSTNFTVNGKAASTDAPPATPLLWVIREGLKLTGTKFGCGTGLCGACMVHIDGKRAYSCQTQVSDIAGKTITTIEGLEKDGLLHPVQEAFLKADAMQCAYCTSGMIMASVGLLAKNPAPNRDEIVKGSAAQQLPMKIVPLTAFSGRPPSAGGLKRASRHVPVQTFGSGSIFALAWVSL